MPDVLEVTGAQRPNVPVAQVDEEEEELLQTSAQPQQPQPSGPTGGTGAPQQPQAPTATGAGGVGDQPPGGGEGPGDRGDEPQEPQGGTGPVGSGDHVVRDGDCISSIAKQKGHFWETIWNDSGNSDLKSARQDPNVLLPGDRVTVPDLRPKQESGATEEHHRFRRKGEPGKLRIRLVKEPEDERAEQESQEPVVSGARDCITEDPETSTEPVEDEPRANVPYILDVDGERTEGTTDADGRLETDMPGNSQRAKLILNPGTEQEEEIPLQLGHLSPISEISGVKQRLANLTFDCGDRTEEMTDGLRQALQAFQQKNGLEPNGELTEETRQKIKELHGS
ncbi:MAG: peptidoglycan-binding protein [Planctomycetota bacterium]|jgi:N-acetylmuramoyl-L-alanine amidase